MFFNKHALSTSSTIIKPNLRQYRRRRRYKKSWGRKQSIVTVHRIIRSRTHLSIQTIDSSNLTKSKHYRPSVEQLNINMKQSAQSSHRKHSLGDIHDLIVNRRDKRRKRPYPLYAFFCITCSILFLAILLFVLLMKSKTGTPSRLRRFNINMLINGNAETGPCEMGNGITSPTIWNYNGSITQYYYNNSAYISLTLTTPGPSDRGNCYFGGEKAAETTMWQTIDLNNYVDPFLIDSRTVRYNLSAWIGGWSTQDDAAVVSLIFNNHFNQILDNRTSIGPVRAIDRGGQTSLLFRQTNGLVPVGTRNLTVFVRLYRVGGLANNGNVDNISINLY